VFLPTLRVSRQFLCHHIPVVSVNLQRQSVGRALQFIFTRVQLKDLALAHFGNLLPLIQITHLLVQVKAV